MGKGGSELVTKPRWWRLARRWLLGMRIYAHVFVTVNGVLLQEEPAIPYRKRGIR